MKRISLVTILFIFIGSISVAQPFLIGHKQQTFIDAARSNRSIDAEIYYPANSAGDNVPMASGAFPTLIFGHGFVMTWDAYDYLWNGIVPSGYILVFPKSEGSFSPSHTDFGKDIAFLVDAMKLEGLNQSSTFYNAVSDKSAVMGHSMGGGSAFLSVQYNSSITALATLAAAVTNPSSVNAASGIQIPSLTISGANDCIAPTADHQTPMYNALVSSCKTYINLLGASHCQFAGTSFTCSFGEATCLPASAITSEVQHNLTLQLLLPWLANYLKNDCDAGNSFQEFITNNSAFTFEQNCTLSCNQAGMNQIQNEFSISPNPVQNQARLLAKKYLNDAEIRVVNLMGKIEKHYSSISGSEITLDFDGMRSGIYIIQISDRNYTEHVRIMVIK
jgi:pimeloyl-ACP methyl ester carboxylesterase